MGQNLYLKFYPFVLIKNLQFWNIVFLRFNGYYRISFFFYWPLKIEIVRLLSRKSLLKMTVQTFFVSVPFLNSNLYLLLFRCCKLTGETKVEAVLSACLLLPPLHAASLTVLMRFLAQVAQNSIHNKMDSRSLAIVFTPCLFPVSESATNLKKVESTNADLANKLEIVETLIKNATKVCMIDQPMEDALSIPILLPTGINQIFNEFYLTKKIRNFSRKNKSKPNCNANPL